MILSRKGGRRPPDTRPTIGLLLPALDNFWKWPWLGVVDAARAHSANVIRFAGTVPDIPTFDRQGNILYQPEVQRIPIIATSASVSEADQLLSREAGYNAFLPKPILWLRLAGLLERYLELEWVYADEAESDELAEPLVQPPSEELAVLRELAVMGDILALQARAAQLEQGEVRWRAFARQLAHLAGQFELEQVLALLAQYPPPNRHA